MAVQQAPVEPGGVVVQAVRVVVPELCAAHLVAHEEHGRSEGEEDGGEEVLHLAVAQPLDGGIVRWALDAAVPAAVVVRAVAVLLAVGLVVLAIVGDEVIQREAVVAGDEVHALLGLSLLVTIDVGTAEQPVRHIADRAGIAPREAADIVAEPAVPLLPPVADERADLVEAGGIPGFGDELGAREHGVVLDVPQNRGVRRGTPRFVARENGRQVEAESIHVHLLDPVMQAVENQSADDRVVRIERVACTRVVGVTPAIRFEDVVRRVLEAAEGEGRPAMIALGRVVVHDVENDLEAGPVQRLHHVPELVERTERIGSRRVPVMGREE